MNRDTKQAYGRCSENPRLLFHFLASPSSCHCHFWCSISASVITSELMDSCFSWMPSKLSHTTDLVMGFELTQSWGEEEGKGGREENESGGEETGSAEKGNLFRWFFDAYRHSPPLFTSYLPQRPDFCRAFYCFPFRTAHLSPCCSNPSYNLLTAVFLCPPFQGCFIPRIQPPPRFSWPLSYLAPLDHLIHYKASTTTFTAMALKSTPSQNSQNSSRTFYSAVSETTQPEQVRRKHSSSTMSFLLQMEHVSPKFMLKPHCQCDDSRRWGITG